ncbi:MAG: FapA family protein [Schwartzia sp.]|nr:FapA family protein [Schwartzia sp. (in: firmicutes)]
MDENEKISEVGGETAGYLFEFKSDGVYLTVYPNDDNGILFELSDMRQILKDYGVADYDIELLARVVRTADGVPVRLADRFISPVGAGAVERANVRVEEKAEEVDDRETMSFTVDVAKDRMTAKIRIERDAAKKPPTAEAILQALADRRITYGIDNDAINAGLEHGSEFIAAKGTAPQNGIDAKIERKFSLAEKGKPAVNKYDQVDYKNMNLFVLAKKGQVLAERIPHTQGIPGTNIFGDEIRPKPGKPKPVPAGKNTEIRDENLVVSLIEGQIVDNGTKISVDPKLNIDGDVGVGTGNIDFVGAVDIGGSVMQGFIVKATGDINIKGMVSGGVVHGYNVYIAGGVQGMNRGEVRAEEEVRAAFVENAKIEAGGNIFITDVALHSDLRAGKVLAVEGKRGLVTGGYLAAGEEIRAKTIGNTLFVATKLVVGVNPMLQRRYQETCKEYAELKKKLSQLTKALNTLGKIDVSKLPPERAAQISQMTRSQFPLAGKIERDEKLIRELEEQIAQMRIGRIRVADKMYPGTRIIINSVMKNIQSEEQHCTLTVEDDEIKSGAY